jgi:polyisoprenyl-phosphate glycosyltransferase
MTQAVEQTLSVVAPAFNEEAVLPEFLMRTVAACETSGMPFEIVLVDDGSRDRTWALIQAASGRDKRIRGVRLLRNFGHQTALTAGLRYARGSLVLAIDADLQDPPELLLDMIRVIERENADVVYGQRSRRDGETLFKKVTAHLFYRLIGSLADIDIPRDTGDFRLMRRHIVDALNNMPEHNRFVRGMVAWIGGRQIPLVYDRNARHAGESKYPVKRMVKFAVDAVTGFSVRPLRLATFAGFLAGLASLMLGIWAVAGWTLGYNVPGWTSLMFAISTISGLQFLFLGLLGEYIGRLYETSRNRPLFMISTEVGDGLGSKRTKSAVREFAQ